MIRQLMLGLVALCLVGCAGQQGTTTTPITTTAVGEAGRDAGTASATESGSAVNNVYVIPILAAKKVTISKSGVIEVTGADNAEVAIGGAGFGNFHSNGNDVLQAELSSGGGAAGGTGGAARTSTPAPGGGQ